MVGRPAVYRVMRVRVLHLEPVPVHSRMALSKSVLAANQVAQRSLVGKPRTTTWDTSPFRWLAGETPLRKAAAALVFLKEVAAPVIRLSDSDLPSCLASGTATFKVKISCQWSNGQLAFEQIQDEPYSHLAMLGILPHDVMLWVLPKADALRISKVQHSGDSRWIRVQPRRCSDLSRYGGPLEEGLKILAGSSMVEQGPVRP